jgi:hypothetical protein
MKQLTIYASPDLEDRVVTALRASDVVGFLRLGDATGNAFTEAEDLPRTMTWEAVVFVVPGAEDDRVRHIVDVLRDYANACETRPCLRIVVSPVDEVL